MTQVKVCQQLAARLGVALLLLFFFVSLVLDRGKICILRVKNFIFFLIYISSSVTNHMPK